MCGPRMNPFSSPTEHTTPTMSILGKTVETIPCRGSVTCLDEAKLPEFLARWVDAKKAKETTR